MKSRKLLSLIVAAVVVFGTSTTGFAKEEAKGVGTSISEEQQVQVSKDKAVKIAKEKFKEYFNYEFDESKFEISMTFRPSYYSAEDPYVWDVIWNYNDHEKSINLFASIDSKTGRAISMRVGEYNTGNPNSSIPKITQQQAQKTAESFLAKVLPEKMVQTVLLNNPYYKNAYGGYYPVNYNFNYQRVVQGIPYEGNYFNVEVDGITGKLLGFDSRWDEELKLPDAIGVIGNVKIEQLFRDKIKLDLSYIPVRNKYEYEYQPGLAKAVYSIDSINSLFIDAKTGEVINFEAAVSNPIVKDLTSSEKLDLYLKIAIAQPDPVELNNEKAEAIIQEKLKELYGEGFIIQDLRYVEDKNNYETNGRKAWIASFQKSNQKGIAPEYAGSVTIDASTGKIISLYRYDYNRIPGEENIPKLTWEQAYYKALEAVAKYYPDRIMFISTKQVNMNYNPVIDGKSYPQTEYYFNFQRLENNIPYANNFVSVGFDAVTGEVRELRDIWYDKVEFTPVASALKSEEAENELLKKYEPQLAYVSVPRYDKDGKYTFDVKLIYRLKNKENLNGAAYLDAFTGSLLDWDGFEVQKYPAQFYEKIKGHKAEAELSILAYLGILDTNNFEPDKAVTKMDLVKMLVDAKGYRPYVLEKAESLKFKDVSVVDMNYRYLQMAVYYGIMENKPVDFNGDAKVTREELAKVLVKLIGYDNLAQVRDIFTLPVDDRAEVGDGNIGYLSISKGLGILEVTNGKIRPKDYTTNVEMAVGIYKVLENLRRDVYYK